MTIQRMLGEFVDADQLLVAIEAMRAKGYSRLEVYEPFPVHGVDEALGARGSRLPYAVLVVGLGAAASAYALQWLLNAYLYPLDVGHRPTHFPLAFVPITFEMGVLFAAFAAFFGVLALGKLLRLWHPVFEIERFESASEDRFWLEVAGADARFDVDRTADDLRASGATRVTMIEGVS